MVLSHRNHGNFSKKVTCFLNANHKEKPKCQDFSEIISCSEEREHAFFSLAHSVFHERLWCANCYIVTFFFGFSLAK